MYYCCGITEKGIMPHNEDAMLIGSDVADSGSSEQNIHAPFIAAVSDGVSGERSGEVASKMCLELVRDIHYSGIIRLDIRLHEIHRQLAKYSAQNPETHNMQATLCGIAVDEKGGILSFNVGDSRLYRFRHGRISQISRDQSLVQLLYEEGTITLEQRRTHVHRNIIFPAFGNINTVPKIDITPIEGGLERGDVLLLCTDGISDYLSPLDMEEFLELPKKLPERLELMVKSALEKGCKDNLTVIAIVEA
ncbi:MAG: protein phosphatase 2C domain-containing protein [Ruminococcus flavefaciens]|nr:protein phosphatase 2C domain-containing protein [Ruminococcus flavefaciens]MCM1360774.1 protein phosphatase 2C domain-containing protein [Clostridiales bacterium]MCM1435153.1 protein phosphatase 2C domain-containing protein [Ruminococcus flavefaciens]